MTDAWLSLAVFAVIAVVVRHYWDKAIAAREQIAYLTSELAAAEADLVVRRRRVTVRPPVSPETRPSAPTDAELADWAASPQINGQPWFDFNGRPMDVIEEGNATPRLAPPPPRSIRRRQAA